ncbi:MAG: GDSL-type esterase/lipase family protein [Bacillota bacterium]|nr:GDSL-type esterase/lipase family protein [Bacillota bacterium]
MKFFIYLLSLLIIVGIGISIWIYYPEYQIKEMKKHSVEAANNDSSKVSYISYFRRLKSPEIYHLALGDSVIRGVGSQQNKDLVFQFSNKLGAQIHKKIEYKNEGINGVTSSELDKIVQEGHFDPEIKKADIITINVGGNDVLRLAKKQNFNNLFQTFDQVQTSFSNNLLEITMRIKKLNPKATIVYLELYNPLPQDNKMYTLADKLLPRWNLKIYQVANQIPASIVVETPKVISGEKPQNLSTDGIHPSSEGYTAITDQIIFQFKHQYRKESA